MTLWDQLGGRTWRQRTDAQADGSAPPRRRQGRRRKLVQPRRRPRGATAGS
jgi:hypothetical protein